jgi:branched-chain amino acid transport system substrate-binding protein
MNPKIGVLLPTSEYYTVLASDFLNGLKLSFSRNDLPIPTLLFESVGTATNDSILKIAEKFIIQDEIDLAVGFCGIKQVEKLYGLFDAYQKSFIHTDLGANIYEPILKSDYNICQSFNLWQAMYYAGYYSSESIGKNVAMTSSFYEAGYQLFYAFFNGVIQNGGQIVHNHLVGADYKTHDFGQMISEVKNVSPDVVLNLFSYKEGEMAYHKMVESGIMDEQCFVYNPLMADIFTKDNSPKNHLITVNPFYVESESDFMKSYQTKYKKSPNEIALLGFETGLTIQQSMQIDPEFEHPIAQNLKNLAYETPRGKLSLNAYNELQIDCFTLIETKANQTSYNRIDLGDNTFYPKADSIRHELTSGGWFNPYMCT